MPRHGQLYSDEEVKGAGFEGLKGALHGACVVSSSPLRLKTFTFDLSIMWRLNEAYSGAFQPYW